MGILCFTDSDGAHRTYEFRETTVTRIGSAETDVELRLPASMGVHPQHAAIMASKLNRLPVFIDLSNGASRISGREVIGLKVLRQGDRLTLGSAELSFWQVFMQDSRLAKLKPHHTCPVCLSFPDGDVIQCPRCSLHYHHDCWLSQVHCAQDYCGYPNRDVTSALLSELGFKVEQYLPPDTGTGAMPTGPGGKAIPAGARCAARGRRDVAGFKKNDHIAHCPHCAAAYHLSCCVEMKTCRNCNGDIAGLIRKALTTPWQAPQR